LLTCRTASTWTGFPASVTTALGCPAQVQASVAGEDARSLDAFYFFHWFSRITFIEISTWYMYLLYNEFSKNVYTCLITSKIISFVFFFETRSPICMSRLASNSSSFCLSLLSAGITGVKLLKIISYFVMLGIEHRASTRTRASSWPLSHIPRRLLWFQNVP
jgi:hypothetical protein